MLLIRVSGALKSAEMFSRIQALLQSAPNLASYRLIFDMRLWEAMIPDSEIEDHFAWVLQLVTRSQLPFSRAMRMAFLTAPYAGTDSVVSRIGALSRAKTHIVANAQEAWNYVFYLEVAGHEDDLDLQTALIDLKKFARVKVLGSYPLMASIC